MQKDAGINGKPITSERLGTEGQLLAINSQDQSWIFFWGVISIYAIEYIGLRHYIPGIQRVPLFLSLLIFSGLFFQTGIRRVFEHGQTKALAIFFIHTFLSMAYAIVGTYAFNVVKVQMGYIILYIITYYTLASRKKISMFITSFLLFHCFIILTNVQLLSTTERLGSFRAGYFLGDGNDLSWSLITFMPFAIYFFHSASSKAIKCLMLTILFVFGLGIIGTGSRGAFLGLTASICYLIINSKNKVLAIAIATMLGIIAISVTPIGYFDRIASIGSYREDSSALGRIMAWKAAVQMAIGHPLGVGAGNFNSAYGRYYRPSEIDSRIWRGARWISPHSIYFLVLGEYGIIGLATLLTLIGLNYRDNQKQVNINKRILQHEVSERHGLTILPKYLNMSLVAFCIGGVFLGGINYPHLFVLTAVILRTRQFNEANHQNNRTNIT